MSVEGVPSVDDVAAAIRAEDARCGDLQRLPERYAAAVHALYAPVLAERDAAVEGRSFAEARLGHWQALAVRYREALEEIVSPADASRRKMEADGGDYGCADLWEARLVARAALAEPKGQD